MAIGWFSDIGDAEDYFTDERLETEAWDDLESGMKDKAIVNAYNRMYYDPRWEFPTYDEATVEQLVKLRKINGEMAYYLAVHLDDEDRRKGIQAQGVVEAGVVKETYDPGWLGRLPVPPFVVALAKEFEVEYDAFGSINLARDENESVGTKVHDF